MRPSTTSLVESERTCCISWLRSSSYSRSPKSRPLNCWDNAKADIASGLASAVLIESRSARIAMLAPSAAVSASDSCAMRSMCVLLRSDPNESTPVRCVNSRIGPVETMSPLSTMPSSVRELSTTSGTLMRFGSGLRPSSISAHIWTSTSS